MPLRTLPSTSFGRGRCDEELATLQREHASLQHAQELHCWVGDGALHLKRKGSHSDSQRSREAVREPRALVTPPGRSGDPWPVPRRPCPNRSPSDRARLGGGARLVGARGLRELSLAPARLSCLGLKVRFRFIACTRGRGLLAATATLPFGGSLERPVQLRAELQASRFGFGLQISESDPRSSQSSKASAKALTPATSTRPRLRAASVPLDCKAKAWSASLSFHDASVHRQLPVGLDDLAGALLKQLVLLQMELPKLDLLQGLPRSGWDAACCGWLLRAARPNSENGNTGLEQQRELRAELTVYDLQTPESDDRLAGRPL